MSEKRIEAVRTLPGRGGAKPARVVMLLSNPASHDPRVQKEARALAAAGYEVVIVAWDRLCDHQAVEEAGGYRIERVRARSSYGEAVFQIPALLLFCALAAAKVRRLAPAILHCHDLEMLPAGFALAKVLGCRLLFDAHEPNYFSDARRLRRVATGAAALLERSLSPRADAVLVTNDYQLKKYRRIGAENVRLVANYPERSLICELPHFRESGPLTIGRIGATYHDMGIEELAEAYRVLRGEFPGLKLLLVGQSTEKYRSSLTALIGRMGGDAELVGRYRYGELPSYYRRLDLCVLPQKKTPWFEQITPTKFFEVLCFGKPVVTTDIGGIGKIVREERCGVVLDRVTPEAICEALRPLLRQARLRREMGMRGIEAIRRRYNWDFSIESLLQAYDDLAGDTVMPGARAEQPRVLVRCGDRKEEVTLDG